MTAEELASVKETVEHFFQDAHIIPHQMSDYVSLLFLQNGKFRALTDAIPDDEATHRLLADEARAILHWIRRHSILILWPHAKVMTKGEPVSYPKVSIIAHARYRQDVEQRLEDYARQKAQIEFAATTQAAPRAMMGSASTPPAELYVDSTQTAHMLLQYLGAKDDYTLEHSYRVFCYAKSLLGYLQGKPGSGNVPRLIPEQECHNFLMAALLHDMGKIVCRDEMLLCPGKLTREQYLQVNRHPFVGFGLITSTFYASLVNPLILNYDQFFLPIMFHHLAPDAIEQMLTEYHPGKDPRQWPKAQYCLLGTTILKLCDSLDAMTSRRSYNKQMTIAEATALLISDLRTPKAADPRHTPVDLLFDQEYRRDLIGWLTECGTELEEIAQTLPYPSKPQLTWEEEQQQRLEIATEERQHAEDYLHVLDDYITALTSLPHGDPATRWPDWPQRGR